MNDRLLVTFAILLFLAIPIGPAIIQNLREDGGRFRVKTLLLTIGLIACAMGLIAYLTQNNSPSAH